MLKLRNLISLPRILYRKQPRANLNTYAGTNENLDDFYGLFWNNLRNAVQIHNQFVTVVNNIDRQNTAHYNRTSKKDNKENSSFDIFNIKSRLKMIKEDISYLWCPSFSRSILFTDH